MTEKSFYITTPIYYANDRPHIGHAYTDIVADVRRRYEISLGKNVKFLSGTDEHGQKMYRAARDLNRSPKEHADIHSTAFRKLLSALDCDGVDFIRTTEKRHHLSVRALWSKLEEAGDIYLGKYSGWYSVRDEAYWDESELSKQPDGTMTAPSGAEAQWFEEPSHFFRLTKYREPLLEHFRKNPDFVTPASRANEVVSFIKSGLRDLSISRASFDWGVEVPGTDGEYAVYVWLDALTNYISALGYPDFDEDGRRYWNEANHVLGKDILRFHAVYWPAFLMSAGIDLPKRLFVHGWWTVDGQKMSKSIGNVVDPFATVESYGTDRLRYFLCRNVPFGRDGDFSIAALKRVCNSDLSNNFGNLAQRSISMAARHFDGGLTADPAQLDDATKRLLAKTYECAQGDYRRHMEGMNYHLALSSIVGLLDDANKYFDAREPWKTVKAPDGRDKTARVLYATIENLRCIAIMLSPFIPKGCDALLDCMAVDADDRTLAAATGKPLASGTKLLPMEPLFLRV